MFGFRKKFGFFRYCTGKLPEGSGGFRRGPEVRKMFHHLQYSSMVVRGHPSLNGPGAPAPQGPCAWEGENPKGEGLHLTWEALLPPWPHPLGWETLKGAQPPSPYIYLRFWGCQHMSFLPLLVQPCLSSSSSPVVLGEALQDCHAPPPPPRRRAAVGALFLNLSLLLAGSRRGRCPRSIRVLNAEVSSVRR